MYVKAMSGTAHFPATDWRFNEFPNPAAHALYVTCVELMALPVAANLVANSLLDVVAKGYCSFIFKLAYNHITNLVMVIIELFHV